MKKIPIYSDPVSQEELKDWFRSNTNVTLEKIENPEKFRNVLSDPVVLAAIIKAGGAVISATIAALASMYHSRKKEGKNEGKGIVIINIDKDKKALPEAQVIIPLDEYNAEKHIDVLNLLEKNPEVVENINYTEEA